MKIPTAARPMPHTLKVLAWLLRYPDTDMRAALPELAPVLRAEAALGAARIGEIEALAARLAALPPLQAEAEYVELFDRGRRTALHLFEHVHGDSRDRGPAMVDLAQTYERAGLLLRDGELPDYLPVLLEFASLQPPAEARGLLGEIAAIARAIFSALADRQSAYAAVLAALLELAGEKAERVVLAAESDIDDTWAEPPAFDGCSSAGQAQPIRIVRPARERRAGA